MSVFTHALGTNNYGTAKFIVDSSPSNGTHTTIASALTSSSSGDTIFIRPGTYTENLTLKAGVNLVAYDADAFTPNVTIVGTCTFTAAGTVTFSGIRLQTNSAFALAVTGSAASIVKLINCYVNCTNNTGISFTTSSASASIMLYNCQGDVGTTGIGFFAHSSAGSLDLSYSYITNSGSSTTTSSQSSGLCDFKFSRIFFVITTSSTASFSAQLCVFDTNAIDTTALTIGGSGQNSLTLCEVQSDAASAISVGAGATLDAVVNMVNSTNTNAITGAGTIRNNVVALPGSKVINTTTQTGGTIQGGVVQLPSAGFLGEQIRSAVATSSTTLTSTVTADVTSISLTAGTWDVYGQIEFNANSGAVTGTNFHGSIVTTSTATGTPGDNYAETPTPPTAASDSSICIAGWRLTIASTTTVYLTAAATFTVGTVRVGGRISGTRVG